MLGAGLTTFGLIENPHTWWPNWWTRNIPLLFGCQAEWSSASKILVLAVAAGGLVAARFAPRRSARILAPVGIAVLVYIAAAVVLTWPPPGCPPTDVAG